MRQRIRRHSQFTFAVRAEFSKPDEFSTGVIEQKRAMAMCQCVPNKLKATFVTFDNLVVGHIVAAGRNTSFHAFDIQLGRVGDTARPSTRVSAGVGQVVRASPKRALLILLSCDI